MLIGLIYFFVIIFANTLGAIAGIGGGIIIKPILDAIGYHSVTAVSFYSSVAVFTMSLTAVYKQISNGIKIKVKPALMISTGSVVGGFFGGMMFDHLLFMFPYEEQVKLVQIGLTLLSLTFVLRYTREGIKTYLFEGLFLYLLVGIFLGWLASLLGIGGGPINVTLLMLLFSIPIKEATTYSIITIFISQLTRLISIGLSTGYGIFDLSMLYWIIPAATLGGALGGKLSKNFPDHLVLKIFKMVVISVIFLNLWNGMAVIFFN